MDITKIVVRCEGEVNTFWTLHLADGSTVECESIDQESPVIGNEKVYKYDERQYTELGPKLQQAWDYCYKMLGDMWDSDNDAIEYTWNIKDKTITDITTQKLRDETYEYIKHEMTVFLR